jgi:hypothetical protein
MSLNKVVIVTALLTGCASIPNVTYNYYPARWSSSITVIQTLGCTSSGEDVLAMHAYSVSTSYSSDLDKPPYSIRIKDIDRFFADTDFTMTLTDDGRLRGINQSSIGQGEGIVKSAVALVSALKTVSFTKSLEGTGISPPTAKDCKDIDKWGGNKPITIIYRVNFSEKDIGKSVPVEVSSESEALYERLSSFLPSFIVKIDGADQVKEVQSRPVSLANDSDTVPLTLQKIGSLGIQIVQAGRSNEIMVYSTRVLTPLRDTYTLPIPKAALFGKQSISLILSDAGAVTSIGYGKTVGVSGALNAMGALANTQTAATEAAETKAQADLIAQQQRLMLCRTKPDQCK